MPLPFSAWTLDDAKKAAALADALKPLVESAQKFYEGDHWQNGQGWIGPRPMAGEEGEAETLKLIQDSFVSRNVIKEIVDRHKRGVIGNEPEWGFTVRRALDEEDEPSPEEQADIDEIEAALTEWWDKRKVHRWLKKAIGTLLQAQRSCVRLYVPKGKLTTSTSEQTAADGTTSQVTISQVVASDLSSALDNVFVDHPSALNAAVYTDPESQTECGIVIYRPFETPLKADSREVAELTWVDENDKTHLRRVGAGSSQEIITDFAGQMPMHEMLREQLITKQVVEAQRAVNLAETIIARVTVTGGFLERILLNAQMPGMWVDDDGKEATDFTSRKRFIPAKFRSGANTTNFINGLLYEDPKDQSLKLTDPSVQFREPTPATTAIDAKKSYYGDMLEETDQSHVLLASEPVLSGRSRAHARAEYVSSLTDTKDVADALGRWLLEAALAEAEAFAGSPGVLSAKYRATFSCRVNAGPIEADERAADETSVEKGTMSDETAMERRGTVDVDAEKARINQSERGQLDTLKRQGEAMQLWTSAGVSLEGAAKIVIGKEDPLKIIKDEAATGGFNDPNNPNPANPNPANPANPNPTPPNAPPAPVAQ